MTTGHTHSMNTQISFSVEYYYGIISYFIPNITNVIDSLSKYTLFLLIPTTCHTLYSTVHYIRCIGHVVIAPVCQLVRTCGSTPWLNAKGAEETSPQLLIRPSRALVIPAEPLTNEVSWCSSGKKCSLV